MDEGPRAAVTGPGTTAAEAGPAAYELDADGIAARARRFLAP
jgi:hypothetical protein